MQLRAMNAAPHPSQAAGVLARLPLFKHVSREHLDELLRDARTLYFRRGEAVARHGEMVPGLLAVAYGMIKLVLYGGTGTERVLRLVGPGQTFGEVVLFLRRPLPVDAIAVTDTRVVLVPAARLLALVEGDAHFPLNLIASLCQRMHTLICEAAYLESLAVDAEAERVTLPAAKKLIAGRLGMTKETFSRALHELVQAGLLSVAGREIVLLDRAGLERVARA